MIERCFDLRRVKHLADWELCISQKIIYLVDVEDGKDVGVWAFHTYKDGYMVHASMGEGYRGARAAKSLLDSFKWMFTHTSTGIIFAEIPIAFRKVHFIVRHVGMRFDGIEAESLRCYSLTKQAFTDTRGEL